MRPHQLQLTAFGPFAGTVDVDLDALAEAGLFLLHGPTGAGKTTLLDGIGFALFGRVPGVRNGAKRLRSDYGAPGVRTEVRLEATLGGRRLRITRAPQQERSKARGTGTTTEQARVLLEEHVGGSWTTVSTRVGEADAEIADLVGMSAEQFFQVVLLPQGDFAQFLRASSVDRAAVLQKLFATERFADAESWLVARRRACAEQVTSARGALSRLLARIAEVAGLDLAEDELLAIDHLTWAGGLVAAAVAAEAAAAEQVEEATTARDACRAHADEASRLAGLQHRRQAALVRRAELDQMQPVLRQLQAEVDAAARAAEVAAVIADVEERRTAREIALAAEDTARSGLEELGLDLELPVEGLHQAAGAARERAGRLGALRTVDAGRRTALHEASVARDEHADALAQVATLEVEQLSLPGQQAQAASRLAAAREAAARSPQVRAARDALALLRPDVLLQGQITERLTVLAQEELSARETAVALMQKANDLKVASINSMVAALAFRLEDGVPCDVCGSVVHPDPSRLRDEGVSSDDEERARREAEAAHERVGQVQSRLAAERATLAALSSRVGALTLDQVDEQLAALDLELATLAVVAAEGASSETLLAALEQQRNDLATARVAAASRADACERRATEADLRADTCARELAEVLGDDPELSAALARTTAVAETAGRAASAAEALRAAQAELDRALVAAEMSCLAAGFAGSEQATAAARSPAWREQALVRLREAADATAAVAAELADPTLAVDLAVPAAVEETTVALAYADHVLAAALADLGERRQRRSSLERLLPALEAELLALRPLEARSREARTLADLCTGTGANNVKMTLTSFVLAARLEEVAAAASVRLLRMTQGRYSLVHTDGAARGGVRSGLGLLARDGWSGQDRDTSTLSGGETFLASLALALGLADVVSAEAGGSRIGALFVDEGFGTLDEDTLDEVMDVLDSLRAGGRIVGLVSHVAELRQRIPAQVHVTKTRAGSDLVLLGC